MKHAPYPSSEKPGTKPDLDSDTEKFLANGGKVESVPDGKSNQDTRPPNKRWNMESVK